MPRGDIIAKQLAGDTIAELPHFQVTLLTVRQMSCSNRVRIVVLYCLSPHSYLLRVA